LNKIKGLKKLQDCIGIQFHNVELLSLAMTHPTYVFENRSLKSHNQRLEFLGDAVLGMVVAEYLFKNYPKKPEGDLTKLRAVLVCENTLSENARRINLGSYLLLGRGEELSGGRERQSILADTYEALVGAIYLDHGLEAARDFVLIDIKKNLSNKNISYQDHKTLLQEIIQKYHNENVSYAILEESGPDHDKCFVAGVFFKEKLLAKGIGKSKKEAEQRAAKLAYKKIHDKVKIL
jgi:ribonuclease-3